VQQATGLCAIEVFTLSPSWQRSALIKVKYNKLKKEAAQSARRIVRL
jgi:hypothetical protein